MISPIHSRLNNRPGASQENLGDETRELEAMKNDIKTPIRDKYGHIVSQHPAARGDSTALESKRRKMQQTIAFGRTSANKAMKANPSAPTINAAVSPQRNPSASQPVIKNQAPQSVAVKSPAKDLQNKKNAIHDVYKQYAQMKQNKAQANNRQSMDRKSLA